MRRTIQFKQTEAGYACFEDGKNIFEVSKNDLQFNVKNFYNALYSEGKDFDNIELENCIENDKVAKHVYDCIVMLMDKIREKFTELSDDV